MTKILYAYINEQNHKAILENFLSDFPQDFQTKILKYRRWEDAQLTLIGRLLLKLGLRSFDIEYKEEDLLFSDYNKPILKNKHVKFNISHSGTIVVCIITNSSDVGIDIEKVHNINVFDFTAQMTDFEFNKIKNATDSQAAFFDFWTQKEAVIKAHGKGLSIPLNTFCVIDDHARIDKNEFFLKKLEIDEDYKCYLAFKDKRVEEETIPKRIRFLEKGK